MESTNQVFEELLVLNAQNGDTKAISLLVNRWNGRIRNQIYRHTHDAEASGDISQEVWIAIFRGIDKLEDVRIRPINPIFQSFPNTGKLAA